MTGAAGCVACSTVRGLILTNDVCACNSANNFEWDANTSTCVCMSSTKVILYLLYSFLILMHYNIQPSLDGICRPTSDSVKWSKSLASTCSDGIIQRYLKTISCKLNSAAVAAPWFGSCDVTHSKIDEDCDSSNGKNISVILYFSMIFFSSNLYRLQC